MRTWQELLKLDVKYHCFHHLKGKVKVNSFMKRTLIFGVSQALPHFSVFFPPSLAEGESPSSVLYCKIPFLLWSKSPSPAHEVGLLRASVYVLLSLVQAVTTKCHGLGGSTFKHLFLIILEAEVQDQVAGKIQVCLELSSWFAGCHLFVSLHGKEHKF